MVLRLLREIQPVGCELPLVVGLNVVAFISSSNRTADKERSGQFQRGDLCCGNQILLFHKIIYHLIIYNLQFIWSFDHLHYIRHRCE